MRALALIILLTIFQYSIAQNVGINQNSPTNVLHITPVTLGNDPLRIDGIQAYTVNEDTSLLVINPSNGVVRYMSASELSNSIINNSFVTNLGDSLINNSTFISNFGDSLFLSQNFIDSLISNIYNNGDTLLTNTTFITNLGDTLINNNTFITNLGNTLLSNSTFVSNFGDSLFLSQNFIDSLTSNIYNNGDTLLYNTSFINSLRDSIDTDVDSVRLNGNTLTIYENGNTASVDLSTLNNLPNSATTGQILTWNGTAWIAQNASSGADNWGSQNVVTGSGLSGNGTTGSPLINTFTEIDGSITNELQTISKSGNTVTLSNGGGSFTDANTQLTEAQVDGYTNNNGYLTSFSEVDGSITNELQNLTRSGSTASLSNGGGSISINDADASTTNEIQTLSLSGTTLSISGANSVSLSTFNGDITGVTAGAGLSGGGSSGSVTLNALANNGIHVNSGADRIRLGGALVTNTTITQANYGMTFNLSGTGDFKIQDVGVSHFEVRDNGVSYFGDDTYWNDGSTTGTTLMSLIDDSNDGRLRIYENGSVQVDLDANSQFIFNELGYDRDFRVESNSNANMFRVDAGNNRIGIGTSAPSRTLDVVGNARIRTISTTTSTTVTPLYSDASGNIYKKPSYIGTGPKFITPITVYSSTAATSGFVTFNAASYIPAGATAVIIEAYCLINGSTNQTSATAAHQKRSYIRKDGSSPQYNVLRNMGWTNTSTQVIVISNSQGTYPCTSSRTFQYSTMDFNGGLKIRLIGYY